MSNSRSEYTRRELMLQGSGLFAATALVATQATTAAPDTQSPQPPGEPSPQTLATFHDAPLSSQNARRLCVATGGV